MTRFLAALAFPIPMLIALAAIALRSAHHDPIYSLMALRLAVARDPVG